MNSTLNTTPATRNQLTQLATIQAPWLETSNERIAWTVTLKCGYDYTITAPLGCAVEIENAGFQIIATPAEQVSAAELHQHSARYAGRFIRHLVDMETECWTRIAAVHVSRYQGVDIDLEGRGTLQACFPEDAYYWVTKA